MKAYIGIGSNILPEANLVAAADLLREEWPDVRFSHVYRSKALEQANQADFLNAVAEVEADRDEHSLHGKLKQLEECLGKAIKERFGPRTIDLDLLLYGDLVQNTQGLILPHPRMHRRRFVLQPMCELIPLQRMHPRFRIEWLELLKKTEDQECERIKLKL
jgi:2-amino-4-hydroxy-6-hydroxymethyldihydropteridine diphosphokinase